MHNMGKLLLGIDVGATKSAVIVGDVDGQISDKVTWPSNAGRGAQVMLDEICANAQKKIKQHGGVKSFSAVGISIGGPLDANEGIIYSPPNLPGWDALDLQQIISDKLHLPVNVEHDAASCALAEYLWGEDGRKSPLIYLTCGSGFGAGVIINGKIYYGARGRSPEIGHVRYSDDGPKAFGKIGSYEAFCAGNSLPKLAAHKFPKRWSESAPDGKQLLALANSGDEQAKQILEINAFAVGSACALLGDLLAPQKIVLGSLAQYFGEKWIENVRHQFVNETLASVHEHCAITKSNLGSALQDYSALAAAVVN